jgi:hypothetical protein
MFELIDRPRYILVPKTTGHRLLSLGRLLVKYSPETQSVDVSQTCEMLEV